MCARSQVDSLTLAIVDSVGTKQDSDDMLVEILNLLRGMQAHAPAAAPP